MDTTTDPSDADAQVIDDAANERSFDATRLLRALARLSVETSVTLEAYKQAIPRTDGIAHINPVPTAEPRKPSDHGATSTSKKK